ncbi:MAG: ABC transporter ATP-binding protein [Caulobacteraceae bacterium]
MALALELDAVCKRYGGFQAVDDLSLDVEAGKIFGFLGPNGAGKTSTLRMVLGLIPQTAGRICVLGASDVRTVRDRIGFLPEERGLYRRMTPIDAVIFFAGLKGTPSALARTRGKAMLEAQGLGEFMDQPMKALSKGMAQKVQLICALAHEPDLVILDEPFSGLDPVNQQGLERLIRGLADRGATVIFSTHVMAHAERLCERVALMARGRKVFEGTVAEARAAAPYRLTLEGTITRDQVAALPGVARVETEAGDDGPRYLATLALGATAQEALRTAFQRELDLRQFKMDAPTLHDAFIVITEQAQ